MPKELTLIRDPISSTEAASTLEVSRPTVLAVAARHGLTVRRVAGRYILERSEVLRVSEQLRGERSRRNAHRAQPSAA